MILEMLIGGACGYAISVYKKQNPTKEQEITPELIKNTTEASLWEKQSKIEQLTHQRAMRKHKKRMLEAKKEGKKQYYVSLSDRSYVSDKYCYEELLKEGFKPLKDRVREIDLT